MATRWRFRVQGLAGGFRLSQALLPICIYAEVCLPKHVLRRALQMRILMMALLAEWLCARECGLQSTMSTSMAGGG